MKNSLETKRKRLALDAKELLATELYQIKGGTDVITDPVISDPCQNCKNSCNSCSPGHN